MRTRTARDGVLLQAYGKRAGGCCSGRARRWGDHGGRWGRCDLRGRPRTCDHCDRKQRRLSGLHWRRLVVKERNRFHCVGVGATGGRPYERYLGDPTLRREELPDYLHGLRHLFGVEAVAGTGHFAHNALAVGDGGGHLLGLREVEDGTALSPQYQGLAADLAHGVPEEWPLLEGTPAVEPGNLRVGLRDQDAIPVAAVGVLDSVPDLLVGRGLVL